MKLQQILEIVEGIVLYEGADVDTEFHTAGSADLMSDMLRFGRDDMLMVTGLTNPQVVRTAEMVGIRALLFVRAKTPPPETMALAKRAGITLLATRYTMYEASGRLYHAGLAGIGPCGEFG